MKKIITAAMGCLLISGTALADITVKVNPAVQKKDYEVEYGYISDMVKPRAERPEALRTTGNAADGQFVIKTLPKGDAQYVIPTAEREYIMIYTRPGDNLTVNINSIAPLEYSVSGTKLMEDISTLDNKSAALLNEYRNLMASGNADPAVMKKISNDYDKIFTDYIAANPAAEAVPFAVMHLEGQDFLNAYNAMTAEAKASPISLYLEAQKQYVERQIEAERRKAQLQSGNVTAPNFTFKDAKGKEVSLTDFRGKWVIIDFWGSWCPWCIKGFPSLKEAYEKYKPELEVLGVACNDKYEAWEAALKKYDLPWVNVYNPEKGGGQLLTDYAVEGFPTKAIINPEGKIVNITTGDDPSFYNVLKQLIGK